MVEIERRHVPRAIDQRTVERLRHIAIAIEYQQASGLGGVCAAIGGGQAADDDPTGLQSHQRGCQANPAWTGAGQVVGVNGREQTGRTAGGNLHDGGTRPLQIVTVVEITDQNVAANQSTRGGRHDRDSVGVDIAVGGHGRRHLTDVGGGAGG